MGPNSIEIVLLILGILAFGLLQHALTSIPTETFKKCAVHKWGLRDMAGWLPDNAPQARKLGAILMCKQCGKLPRKNDE